MKLYLVKARILTPTLITAKAHVRGLVWTAEARFIPGSMMRGALLTRIYHDVGEAQALREASEGLFSVTNLYHSDQEPSRAPVIPAHALASKLKMKPQGYEKPPIVSVGIEKILKEAQTTDTLSREKLASILSGAFTSVHRRRLEAYSKGATWHAPGTDKKCQGEPSVREGKGYTAQGRAKTTHYIQVSLDHATGSTAKGMLYTYELIVPGETFYGYLAVSDSSHIADLTSKTIRVRIGRGVSRGYGLVELEFKEVKPEEITAAFLTDHSSIVALLSYTPTFTPNPLPSPRPPDRIEVPTEQARKLGAQTPKITLKKISPPIGDTTTYKGWSIRTNKPKMPINALAPGTITIYKVEAKGLTPNEVKQVLSTLILGLNYDSSLGYNHFIPLAKDPYPEVIPGEQR